MWNDKETDIDLLGHDKIAQTIIEIIEDKHLRPLTIGVYGDWGVGKSSVISLLQKGIREANKEHKTIAHCIVFNGWLFQGYEDAKTALMETVVTELAALQPRNKRIQKLAVSLIKRVNWLKVAKVSASALVTGLTGVPTGSLLGGIGNVIKKAKDLVHPKEEKEGTNITVENEDDESYLNEAKTETVTRQIHSFRKEFEKLIKVSKADQIIVLVDDLDRCLPKSVIEILEAIRLFLFVEGTTFVISADEKMIEYSVREHFPNLPASYTDYTKNYLEKLIQIPIRIPTLNKLQTGNYIKFLMLQNHLNHNYSELEKIYKLFDQKKKTPYDNLELTYEMITEVFGGSAPKLQETLLVANQLSPTLANGLKGNPRNIKRFLNTLFLRIRVSKIYGLQDVIKLNVLAKLMLLERFQSDKFDTIVEEVTLSQDGLSAMSKEAEEKGINDDKEKNIQPKKAKSSLSEENKIESNFADWAILTPDLADIDLRPYIFISKEKAIAFEIDITFPQKLQELYDQLTSNSASLLSAAGKGLTNINLEEATVLFNKLETECRVVDNLKVVPIPMKGLLRIIKTHTSLESRLVKLIESYPHVALGPWAVTEFSGLSLAKDQFTQLLNVWSAQTDNASLKSIASQFNK